MKRAQELKENLQEDLAVELVDELKQLRRGGGISRTSVAECPRLIELFKSKIDDALYFIENWCREATPNERGGKVDERHTLLNAYAFTYAPGAGNDLTKRRAALAADLKVSTRTIINYEDDAILNLAVDILEHTLKLVFARDIGPLVKTHTQTRRTTTSPKSMPPPSDMRAMIDRQRKTLDDITNNLEEMERLDEKINQLELQIQPIAKKKSKLAEKRAQLANEVTKLHDQLGALQSQAGGLTSQKPEN